jgi:hypothetical protein
VLTAADLPLLRDGVIVANAGHFLLEIDVEAIVGPASVAGICEYADDLMTLELNDGRRIHVISRGPCCRTSPRQWHMSQLTSLVRRPTRSGRCARRLAQTGVTRQDDCSASGNARNFPTRSGNSCWTTSGRGTRRAGHYSVRGHAHR